LSKPHKFRKDFAPEQYEAYLLRKAKSSDALIPEDNEKRLEKFKFKKKTG
jgi:hypothetical protein